MKILFVGDNHYGSFGSRRLAESLKHKFDIRYLEDDYGHFLSTADLSPYDVLLVSAIGDTPGSPHPPDEASNRVEDWLAEGRSIVVFHGGSAAFWKWPWWREVVGLRWVRPNDPDGVAASTHPIVAYELERSESDHPLVSKLEPMSVPVDELYIELEERRPITPLLETTYEGKRFPMAYIAPTDSGGSVLGYLPGHAVEVVGHPITLRNIGALLSYVTQQGPAVCKT